MTVFQPSDVAEAAAVVAWAAAESQSLESGSKRGLGRPPRVDHRLDVSRLAGIVDYDPAELILTARAATPMAEIESELAAKRQMLAFEPPDWRSLIGGEGEPTLGGVLACISRDRVGCAPGRRAITSSASRRSTAGQSPVIEVWEERVHWELAGLGPGSPKKPKTGLSQNRIIAVSSRELPEVVDVAEILNLHGRPRVAPGRFCGSYPRLGNSRLAYAGC